MLILQLGQGWAKVYHCPRYMRSRTSRCNLTTRQEASSRPRRQAKLKRQNRLF